MNKLNILLIALALSASVAVAQEEPPEPPEVPESPEVERPQMTGLEKQAEQLADMLADETLSERKRAYLERRAAIVDVQLRFRDALRDAIEGLEGRERGEAIKAIREELNDELKTLGRSQAPVDLPDAAGLGD